MASYATLAARGNAKAVYWLEISGIPYAFSDGSITEANKATLFTDAYTPTLTFVKALMPLETAFSKSIELLSGEGTTGGIQVGLLDVQTTACPDGLLTWLFGSERSTILRTRLTADVEKHAGGAGHNWAVASSSSFPASGTIYCELDTASYASKADSTHFTTVTRSAYKSPAASHRAYQGFNIYPDVTDHPTQWHGRIVTLYQSFVDVDGTLAGGAAAARASAYPVRGILRDIAFEDDVWKLRCDGIESLLERRINRSAPHAKVAPSVTIPDDGSGGAVVLEIAQRVAGTDDDIFEPTVAAGTYTLTSLLVALNNAIATVTDPLSLNTFDGELTLTADDRAVHLLYTAGAFAKTCEVYWASFPQDIPGQPTPFVANAMWRTLGLEVGWNDWLRCGPGLGAVVGNTAYPAESVSRGMFALDLSSGFIVEVGVTQDAEDSPIANFSTALGASWVAIESAAGKDIAKVRSVDTTNRIITIDGDSSRFHGASSLVHEATPDTPIRIRRLYASEDDDTLGDAVLKLLLSTGVSGYNDATYDTLAEGVGIELPNETRNAGSAAGADALVDVDAFVRFFSDMQPMLRANAREFIDEPVSFKEWFTKRVKALGGYLLVSRGQLTMRKGLFAMPHEGTRTITRAEMIPESRSVSRPARSTIGGVVFKSGYDYLDGKYLNTSTFLYGGTPASEQRENIVELETGGMQLDVEQLNALAYEVLLEYGKENPRYSFALDRVFTDLEAGEVVTISDEGASDTSNDQRRYMGLPNLDGTRGHTTTRGIVLSAEVDYQAGETRVEVVQSRRRVGGFAASAWVVSHADAGGRTTFTCAANAFGLAADGVDASRFNVGELVLCLAVNPDSTQTGSQSFTIYAISGNDITVTSVISVGGANAHFATGQPLAIVHNDYLVQTASAKTWCYVSDGTDIGESGDAPYQW